MLTSKELAYGWQRCRLDPCLSSFYLIFATLNNKSHFCLLHPQFIIINNTHKPPSLFSIIHLDRLIQLRLLTKMNLNL
ncbi:hypothetical protein QVD17_23165 [Tagetes erecta]|uniref:Uncharacterized protein n=1 Tax=Tagetes erecta TaxID=13708 RepID=A0AAD8KIN6_TARER|nr:hypothetical protein QVD17_23165 [Tagetes erecta]